jgi:hypothetical protein
MNIGYYSCNCEILHRTCDMQGRQRKKRRSFFECNYARIEITQFIRNFLSLSI